MSAGIELAEIEEGDVALAAAMRWASIGVPAFPVVFWRKGGSIDKAPAIPTKGEDGHGHLDATTDPARLAELFATASRHVESWEVLGVGLWPGPAGYVVLDVDIKAGARGDEELRLLEEQHGPLPEGPRTITPSGGLHIWLRKDRFVGGRGLADGIDVRADRGWVVAPGTVTPWGSWLFDEAGGDILDGVAVPMWPGWLAVLLASTEAPAADNPPAVPHREQTWHPAVVDRFEQATRALRQAGVGSRHSVATAQSMALARMESNGLAGSTSALDHLGDVFAKVIDGDRKAEREWGRLVTSARDKAMSTDSPSAERDRAEREALEVIASGAVGSGSVELDPCASARIDWPAFWSGERTETDFLVPPILGRGRSHAVFAAPKVGKSLLLLEVAAACATGRAVLGRPASEPINVVYLDMEMTEDDVRERLADLGYGAEVDMSHLHYYLLPSLPPLDTDPGGQFLERIVRVREAQLVVLDTTGRVVEGEENSADTFRAYYRHAGSRLKRLGVTVVRLDHSGKDRTKGQRGSSAKADDVDVVWELSKAQDGLKLRATHRRMAWIRETVALRRHTEPLRHVVVSGAHPQGTRDLADLLEAEGVPIEASVREAGRLLREAGHTCSNDLIGPALKLRRQAA